MQDKLHPGNEHDEGKNDRGEAQSHNDLVKGVVSAHKEQHHGQHAHENGDCGV